MLYVSVGENTLHSTQKKNIQSTWIYMSSYWDLLGHQRIKQEKRKRPNDSHHDQEAKYGKL